MLILINYLLYIAGVTRLSTMEAAKRLGVKPATIYAYVSRGILTSVSSADGKQSSFSASEVEVLARRGRPRQASRSHALDFAIDTAITSITQQELRYRGHNVIDLASTATFEQVADLLLTAKLTTHIAWPIVVLEVPVAQTIFDHVGFATILAGARDPFRSDLAPGSVAQTSQALIAAIVDSLPLLGDGRTPRLQIGDVAYRSTIAGRLWTKLSPRRPMAGMLSVLNAALVLLADHELAVSAVAARVAASTRADPYAVVRAATAAMSGPLHGGASRSARGMLDRALIESDQTAASIDRAASEALSRHGMYPGFGHKVYKDGDPRAEKLLAMLRNVAGGTREMSVVDGIVSAIRKRRDIQPNIDLALAALGVVAKLPEDSGEFIFSVARVAGWCAHAIEEYAEEPLRFRARALFVG
jgi:citrate synthase